MLGGEATIAGEEEYVIGELRRKRRDAVKGEAPPPLLPLLLPRLSARSVSSLIKFQSTIFSYYALVVIANQNLALVLDVKKRIVDAVRDNQVNFPHSMYPL